MRNTRGRYGPALYAYLEKVWTARGMTRNAWCNEVGLNTPTVMRWAEGSDPDIAVFADLAEAADMPILELLVAAGVISADEAKVTPREPRAVDVDEAIENDPRLSATERQALRAVRGLVEETLRTGRRRTRIIR